LSFLAIKNELQAQLFPPAGQRIAELLFSIAFIIFHLNPECKFIKKFDKKTNDGAEDMEDKIFR